MNPTDIWGRHHHEAFGKSVVRAGCTFQGQTNYFISHVPPGSLAGSLACMQQTPQRNLLPSVFQEEGQAPASRAGKPVCEVQESMQALLRPWARQRSTLCDMGSTVGEGTTSPGEFISTQARGFWSKATPSALQNDIPFRKWPKSSRRHKKVEQSGGLPACKSLHHHRWVPTPCSAHACGHTGPTGIA